MPDEEALNQEEFEAAVKVDYDAEYAPKMAREAMRNLGAAESLLAQGRRKDFKDHLRLAEAQLKLVEIYEMIMTG